MSLRRRSGGPMLAVAIAVSLAAPAAADAAYGAIAVNPHTGSWGAAYRAPAKWYAKRQALRKCRGECRLAVWVHDRCAAVVIGPQRFVAGIGLTKQRAIRAARQRAHHRRAPVLAWVCSG